MHLKNDQFHFYDNCQKKADYLVVLKQSHPIIVFELQFETAPIKTKFFHNWSSIPCTFFSLFFFFFFFIFTPFIDENCSKRREGTMFFYLFMHILFEIKA